MSRHGPIRRQLLLLLMLTAWVPLVDAQEPASDSPAEPGDADPVKERILWERATEGDPYVFQAYKPNYVLPATYVTRIDESPFADAAGDQIDLQSVEVKYQFSLRLNLWPDLVGEQTRLSVAYTQLSMFQAYNGSASKPFRETNYSPEVMLSYLFQGEPPGLFEPRVLRVGYQHESNGRTDPLSRSWDRVYADLIFELGRWALSLRPWYRIPEKRSQDDNPDIQRYLGYGDLVVVYPRGGHTVSAVIRNNLDTDTNRGSLELGYSFPVAGQLKGYVQLFTGYGETLIDYDHAATRVGLGIMIHDWL